MLIIILPVNFPARVWLYKVGVSLVSHNKGVGKTTAVGACLYDW